MRLRETYNGDVSVGSYMENMINVAVFLSGTVAELAPEPQLEYALVPPARLGTLLELMGLRRPELAGVLPSCRLMVNGVAADPNTILSDGDQVQISHWREAFGPRTACHD